MGREENGLTVLVVDDDPQARKLLQIVLAIEGYRVVTADGGVQALAAIGGEVPDVVVLDYFMPGMDGPELCSRIRALPLPRRLPLVVLSGLDEAGAQRAAFDAGADEFVLKPLDRAVLRERLARLLSLPRSGGTVAP